MGALRARARNESVPIIKQFFAELKRRSVLKSLF
jgi:hypothetical protein